MTVIPEVLDRPVRAALWACVIALAVFAIQPLAVEAFMGGILFVLMVGAYLLLADAAISWTNRALNRRFAPASEAAGDTALRAARRDARNLDFHLFAWGFALYLCRLNDDLQGAGAMLEYVSTRIGELMLGLGAFVLYVSWRKVARPQG
ncbi:hypothetical protein VVD49_18665 [Uliginosibacterium sp. H3]|uniref:DUF2178 domain-containing protein n=1 Tax=Uliginosibacterium silvisoli TaxID=3114758 RepID=A0ABU6K805_9RHOO|nr:hypothetical protein [Uliginosibacterium sp. H3]